MKKFIILILIGLIFLGVFLYKDLKLRCDYYCSSFHGKILELRYTEQNTIAFKVNLKDDWTHLGTDIKNDIKIEVGDTIIKKSNDYNVIIIKNGKMYNVTSDRKVEDWVKFCRCK